jgi:glycosyltransferase involved in cell wall biosynthesis
MIELSVVIPIKNERASLEELYREVTETLEAWGRSYEVLVIDDGSTDDSFVILSKLQASDPRWRIIRFRRNFGQTAAFSAGFAHARGRLIATSDGDLQNDPRDIPALVAKLDEGYDLVCGWRQRRQDKFLLRKVPSWVANRIIRRLTGVQITDNGCSLKAYRRELLDRISLYAEQHRFIPALSASAGARITEMPVRHHARRFGESKYGISRTVKVLADLFTLKMITTFRSRPLLGFGAAAVPLVLGSMLFAAAAAVAIADFPEFKATAVVFPGAAMLFAAAAFYLVMLGLVAEVALSTERESANEVPNAWEVR